MMMACTEYIQAYTFDFVYKFCHAFKLLSIVYKCTDTSPKHSTLYLGAKSDKRYVKVMNICKP
jgi:hypothetical protein